MSVVVEKELPKGWAEATLEHTTEILDGRRIPINSRERENRKGSIPYYGATGQVGWIDDYIFDEELVLLGEDGAPFFENSKNKAYIVDGKSWVNNHAHVLKGKFGILENKFLLHLLNRIDYHDYVNGTTRLKLNQSSMRRIPIPLPPLNEQKRIVAKIEELFSLVDSAKDTLEKTQVLLKQYRRSLLKWIFFGDFQKKVFRDSDWKKTTVGESFKIIGGGTPSTKNPKFWNGVIPWITSADIHEIDDIRPRRNVSQEGIDNSSTHIIPANSILIVTRVALGKIGITNTDLCINQDIQALTKPNFLIEQKFALYYLSELVHDLKFHGRGTTINGVTKKQLENLSMIIPQPNEQKIIVAKIEESFSLIEKNEILIDKLLLQYKQIKNSILKQAFEGKLVPQDPNDEPAEVLLQRIREEKNGK